MGQLRFDDGHLCRGWSNKLGAWVYGDFVEMCLDSVIHAYIYPFPRNANSGNHAYTPDPIEVDRKTVGRFTGLTDYTGTRLFEGDIVDTPTGQHGKVTFELGTWGIALTSDSVLDTWDYDRLEEMVPYHNTPHFLWNDNFISFYELIDNLCSEDAFDDKCSVVFLLSDETNEELHAEFRELYSRKA